MYSPFFKALQIAKPIHSIYFLLLMDFSPHSSNPNEICPDETSNDFIHFGSFRSNLSQIFHRDSPTDHPWIENVQEERVIHLSHKVDESSLPKNEANSTLGRSNTSPGVKETSTSAATTEHPLTIPDVGSLYSPNPDPFRDCNDTRHVFVLSEPRSLPVHRRSGAHAGFDDALLYSRLRMEMVLANFQNLGRTTGESSLNTLYYRGPYRARSSDEDATIPLPHYRGRSVEILQLGEDIEEGMSTYPITSSGSSKNLLPVNPPPPQSNDSRTKVAKIMLAVGGQIAASLIVSGALSSAKAKWRSYFVIPAIGVGFISSLSAIFLHPKKNATAVILEKIGAIAVAWGIIVGLAMFLLPDNMMWVSGIACLFPGIAMAWA